MTVNELIQLLSKYNNKDVKVNLKLIPNDGTENDDDLNDIDIQCIGEIYTGGLDSDIPFVEIGFQETINIMNKESKKAHNQLNKLWYVMKREGNCTQYINEMVDQLLTLGTETNTKTKLTILNKMKNVLGNIQKNIDYSNK